MRSNAGFKLTCEKGKIVACFTERGQELLAAALQMDKRQMSFFDETAPFDNQVM